MIDRSLLLHDRYYRMLGTMLRELEEEFGRFVVLDVHSYNHRRDGPDAPPADEREAPEINIGTFSMDRAAMGAMSSIPSWTGCGSSSSAGRPIDVRENIAFQGKGEQTRFIHDAFPETGCAIAVEFKKVFMDEWTGLPGPEALDRDARPDPSSLPLLES